MKSSYIVEMMRGVFITRDKSKYKEDEWKSKVRQHLHILNKPKMNSIGLTSNHLKRKSTGTPLSKSWYDLLKWGLTKFFENNEICNVSNRLWTCYQNNIDFLVSKYVKKTRWLAFNYRATNDYSDRIYLAYMINRYQDPSIINFFLQKDIKVDQDELALSECIKWIWRSAIRNFKDVWIYIPSRRMGTLLMNYFGIESNQAKHNKPEYSNLPRRNPK